MNVSLAWKIARRELRGGVSGFRILVICLALGVAAIAAVTSVRDSINGGLRREGAVLLGGDAELEFTYRFATDAERTWLQDRARALSVVADFRSMLSLGDDRALTQVKAVDGAYPLIASFELEDGGALSNALAGENGLPGIVLAPVLADRLGLTPGDRVQLGDVPFVYTGRIAREPDNASAGFSLGPRSVVSLDALQGTTLLAPGTLFETNYRVTLAPDDDLARFSRDLRRAIPDQGYRLRDSRNGAPGVSRFVERLGSFLVLVGLAGLAVGGVGVSSAVRAYLERKTSVIATLKTLGAERSTILLIYVLQVAVLAGIAILIGLLLGAIVPVLLIPLIEGQLPVPVESGVHLRALMEAAIYGALSAAIFVLWPLSRAESIRPAALYRDAQLGLTGLPRRPYVFATLLMLVILLNAAILFSNASYLVVWSFIGIGFSFLLLVLVARGIGALSRLLARTSWVKGHSMVRLALSSVGGPQGETVSVVLSLGLGLTVLSAIGQLDANMRGAIANDLPDVAPSYFVLDIQPSQIDGFTDRLESDRGVSAYEAAPMLRGIITAINGQNPREVAGPHWVLNGDRGVTYSSSAPTGTEITEGAWWPEDYSGEPQISFAAEEGMEMGLSLGDTLTINILGREITGRITSFRNVDFSNAGMGFILSMNPSALSGAPHTYIATIYSSPEAEAPLVRDLSRAYPNITTIRVRDAIDRVVGVLEGVAAATTFGALATLVTGAVVLIGAAAAGESKRRYEAAILKTLGATRGRILAGFALRSLIMGAGAGLFAIAAGTAACWAVTRFVLDVDFRFAAAPAFAIIVGGILLTLLTSLWFSWRAMAVRPARVLRDRD